MPKVHITIENEEGAEVLDANFESVSTAVQYLARHADEFPDEEVKEF